jgi:hypothetical protein
VGERGDGFAVDASISVLVGLGTACWLGLALGLIGAFHAPVVAGVGVLAAAAAWYARAATAGMGERGRPLLEAAGVLAACLALYLPGWDTAIYGSDSTVYSGTGAYLARTGALAIDDPVVAGAPDALVRSLFQRHGAVWGSPRSRSAAGLVFEGLAPPVYSAFSQVPSVWLGVGQGLGGVRGATSVTPLLGALGVTFLYLLVRRLGGAWTALLASALLATSLPQVFFSRFPMSEIGAQAFVLGSMLALHRFEETRARVAALAAGLGLGMLVLARPEYLVFVPLALLAGWLVGGRVRLPMAALVVTGVLAAEAVALLLVVVPTHYRRLLVHVRLVAMRLLAPLGLAGDVTLVVALVALVALFAGAVWWARRRSDRRPLWALAVVAGLAWAAYYGSLASARTVGRPVLWLAEMSGWAVVALAVPGVVLLWRRWTGAAGRLTVLLALVAAAHILVDAHAFPSAVWATRRLLPIVFPVLYAAAATVVVAVGTRWMPVAVVLVPLVLVTNTLPLRPIWGREYFDGGDAAVAAIAARVGPDAIVVLDPGLQPTLLDAALLLRHGIGAIQVRGVQGDFGPLRSLVLAFPGRDVYLVRHALQGRTGRFDLFLDEAGTQVVELRLPSSAAPGAAGISPVTVLPLVFHRVRLAPGFRAGAPK